MMKNFTVGYLAALSRLAFTLSAFSLLTFTALPLTVLAQEQIAPVVPNAQCGQLVKECFATNKAEQTDCFFSASTHPFCQGTDLGQLVHERWVLSPDSHAKQAGTLSLLGPQIVDQSCVSNCDSEFVGALISGAPTAIQIEKSRSCYNSCSKAEVQPMPLP